MSYELLSGRNKSLVHGDLKALPEPARHLPSLGALVNRHKLREARLHLFGLRGSKKEPRRSFNQTTCHNTRIAQIPQRLSQNERLYSLISRTSVRNLLLKGTFSGSYAHPEYFDQAHSR
jgi:hypothetical protein